MKIVVMLCEPGNRAYSDFIHFSDNARKSTKKLLDIVPTYYFRNFNETFGELVENSEKYFSNENIESQAFGYLIFFLFEKEKFKTLHLQL